MAIDIQLNGSVPGINFQPGPINAPLLSLNGTPVEGWTDALFQLGQTQPALSPLLTQINHFNQQNPALLDAWQTLSDFSDQLDMIDQGISIGRFMTGDGDEGAFKFLLNVYKTFVGPAIAANMPDATRNVVNDAPFNPGAPSLHG